MSDQVPLKCVCGSVMGAARLAPAARRLVCTCRSCQAYAKFLGREEELLDEYGGTEVLQLTPMQVSITQGTEQIRCVHLSAKGPLRWYTECCKTPLGNTMDKSWVAFVGVPHLWFDLPGGAAKREALFGPVRCRVHGRHAKGEAPGAHPSAPGAFIARAAVGMLFSSLCGRAKPSPYFDRSGKPVAEPHRLSGDERRAIGLR